MSKELRIHQLDMNPPPTQARTALEKVWYLHRRTGSGQRSVFLSVKRETIIKKENAVNVESSMDGTVAHLFKGKSERKGERKKERKKKQTASICT